MMRLVKVKRLRDAHWVWCENCGDFVGTKPPILHPYWGPDKVRHMHQQGTGHTADYVSLEA